MVVVDVIAECPTCGGVSKLWQTAAYSAFYMSAWTDGWVYPQLSPPPLLKCSRCHRIASRHAYRILGPVRFPEMFARLDLIRVLGSSVGVMKVLRATLKLSLSEARRMSTELPCTLVDGIWATEAKELARQLEQAGAAVQVTEWQEGDASPAEWIDAGHLDFVDDPEAIQAVLISDGPFSRDLELELRLYLFQLWNHPYRDGALAWVPVNLRSEHQIRNARRAYHLLDTDSLDALLLKAEISRELEDFRDAAALLGLAPDEPASARELLMPLVEAHSSQVQVLAICA